MWLLQVKVSQDVDRFPDHQGAYPPYKQHILGK